MEINELTREVIASCIKIHSTIGPGCFEKVYEEILYYELSKRGIAVERQVLMPIAYESLYIRNAYKLDLPVAKKLVVEIKSTDHITPVHFKQVQTHLKLMKEGIHRVFNNSVE